MKVPFNAVTLSLLISFSFNNDPSDFAEAAKLRRGSVEPNEEIDDLSVSDERSLWSVGTLTDAELFAMKKTPPGPLKSSKCGTLVTDSSTSTNIYRAAGMLRKHHPGCTRFDENEVKGVATLPPIDGHTTMPTSASPTTPVPTMSPTTPEPSASPTRPLNCVRTVEGSELIVPKHKFLQKGEVLCLKGDNGEQAYFGYNWSNQFGLFVNGQAKWTAPEASVQASDRWIFQTDGNMLLRDSSGQGIWRTKTGGNWGSYMKVSFQRVWIEDDTGSTLWFQPQIQEEPSLEPSPQPSSQPSNSANLPTKPPTETQDQSFKCVQKVTGTKLVVPVDQQYRRGDMHCLISDDNEVAYFGYTWLNEFGLFVNAETVWTIPSALASFEHWTFEEDGNLVLRDASGAAIWASESHGQFGSRLTVSFERVSIETDVGDNLWSQPPFNCVQTVDGKELEIPLHKVFMKGEVHCLRFYGQEAYFGYTWSNQFGLFVNGHAVWTAPEASVEASDRWIFQSDGNMLLRNSDDQGIWRTKTGENWGSHMKVSFQRVWIESDSGSDLWSQPPKGSPILPTTSPTITTDTPTPPPTFPPTPPPTITTGTPTPPPTMPPTTAPPSPRPTPRTLNCVQTVTGNELSIPIETFFHKGEVHCLRLDNGKEAYFGYTWSDQFGLFVDGQEVWTAPDVIVAASDRWIFQADGNMLLRDSNRQGMWRTHTSGNEGSRMRVSFERVWIESRTGSTLWLQPPNAGFPILPLTKVPTISLPTAPPTRTQDRPLNCVQTVTGDQLSIPSNVAYGKGDVHCLRLGGGKEVYFGYTWSNKFGLFVDDRAVWTAPATSFDRWTFQGDGNLVLRNEGGGSIWATGSEGNWNSILRVSSEGVWIERNTGYTVWAQPPYLQPPKQPTNNNNVNTSGGLQYWAYYYPWYLRNNWSRHDYQDEPLLGKYGTNEVAVAEQHIQWAREAGISTWIISWWGPNHLAMNHFKAGMMNAPSLNKMKFCMLYESVILDGKGSWRDGSKEELMYQHLKVIRDNFFNHPSYLKINGRPVIIFYITRSRMQYLEGFNGPAILANMRRRLGHNIYFIADEPFFDWNNRSPDGNENAFKNGKQVFDAYTTYNMFVDSRVRRGETATDYQLRESMPIWKRWAEKVPLFPNVMPQYYDFRGHKPLLGNSADFMRQLREVACLPRTNFNGAPHIMMVTSFNEWWEGTQIEPENGSPNNWSNYGFQFMETLAAFKKEVDSRGTHWC